MWSVDPGEVSGDMVFSQAARGSNTKSEGMDARTNVPLLPIYEQRHHEPHSVREEKRGRAAGTSLSQRCRIKLRGRNLSDFPTLVHSLNTQDNPRRVLLDDTVLLEGHAGYVA